MLRGFFIEKEMLDFHAEMHDSGFMGQIIVDALGINGACEGFCKCRPFPDCYNVFWSLDNGDTYGETIPYEKIINAIREMKYQKVG